MTNYIANWIQRVEDAVKYWRNAKNIGQWDEFISDKYVYSNLITSCVSVDMQNNKQKHYRIDISSFPEPYYGNPDDSVKKSAVVLLYNPGASNNKLGRRPHGEDTFIFKYKKNNFNYSELSSVADFEGFLSNTEEYMKKKRNSLNVILKDCSVNEIQENPFFMDLVPWHSKKFGHFDLVKFRKIEKQAKLNVFIPATLIAANSRLTEIAKSIGKSKNKIVVFICVGAMYGKKEGVLKACGFNDVTDKVELMNNPMNSHSKPKFNKSIRYTMLTDAGDITYSAESYVRVWKITANELIKGLDDNDFSNSILCKANNFDVVVFAINIWNRKQGMTLPENLGPTINEILKQLNRL
jgi:hypothetical protein